MESKWLDPTGRITDGIEHSALMGDVFIIKAVQHGGNGVFYCLSM